LAQSLETPFQNMPKTTDDVFQLLRKKVYGDPALQARLFEFVDTHQFCLALQETAGELGLKLDEETARTAVSEGGRGWHGRLLR